MGQIRNRKSNDEIEIIYDENICENIKQKLSLQDKKNICLLTFLYILQGIPLGLAGSVPLMLQSYGVSYSTQATFSFVFWPFSLKILWAPVVDSVFVARWGRRKSWLVPVQLLLGVTMLMLSLRVSQWLPRGTEVAVVPLTASFFLLNVLAATQDVAVDGWALTMLSRGAVGWASTCNSVGQTSGYFIAFIVFLALESEEFCNSWLRWEPLKGGLVTFPGFLYFWGIVFLVTTVLVAIFKRETEDNVHNNNNNNNLINMDGDAGEKTEKEAKLTLMETYGTLWRIIKLQPIRVYILSLVLIKVGFSATDSITGLKLIEKGVSKEKMAFIGSLIVPVQIMLAVVVSKYTTGTKPLSVFVNCVLPRMLFGLIFAVFVYVSPFMQSSSADGGGYPFQYYVLLALLYTCHQFVVYPMFVSVMAFYARVSDPAVGGTYMTLLNTVSNLSSNLPNTIMLYLVDFLTIKRCSGGPLNGLSCSSKSDFNSCTKSSPVGVCDTVIDGYYVQVVLCVAFGLVALLTRRKYFLQVEQLPLSAWKVFKSSGAFHSRTV